MDSGNWYVRRGRIGRRTYWLHYVLPIAAASLVAAVLDFQLGLAWYTTSYTSDGSSFDFSATSSGGPILLATNLLLLAPSWSATVTRLHDRGHSAWWLLWGLVPIVGPLVLLITVGFLEGEQGINVYGRPPWLRDVPAARPHPQPVLR
ncbi:DUF805 domain-containing protein [Geodermatophilus marinus]|uniref:DUF805 domain-containing protein n=1 Tax=Geodermatophilus sp. LHW52908 TaxID=2303986 RepID=UPI000E3BA500|nr:DUF805 domain-containing protein [Geodermatophilus sp. LHW52908]RFU21702.1 DUF805 domain-containing protein [Geodermatophilus sp. LHW52908]